MPLTQDDVRGIAQLARLQIDPSEMDGYVADLSRILDFVQQLNDADTTGISPMAHPLDMVQRLRPDEVSESDQRERFQRNAPAVESGLYLVPRVIGPR